MATAQVHVAHHFLWLMVFEVQWHDGFPLHIIHCCNTTREMLWLISITSQALSRNTSLLIAVCPFTAAVPCTEMVINKVVAVARNNQPERSTGMEARVGAEAGHLAARQRVTRAQANEIVKQILATYEHQIENAPTGKRFDACYDLKTVTPTRAYLDLYENVKEKLCALGLDYSLIQIPSSL